MKRPLSAFLLSVLLLTVSSAAPVQFRDHHQDDPIQDKIKKDQAKALNKDRVKEVQKDTTKLLELATELKKSVDAAGDNTLSLDVIRKTDEIEKLAKKVREKMKETYNVPENSHFPDVSTSH